VFQSVAPAAALLFALAASAAAAADLYTVDPASSSLEVLTGKAGLFGGHAHHVRVRRFSGEVAFMPRVPVASTVRLDVDSGSLEVADTDLPARDVAKVQKTMISDRVLGVMRFPRIAFRSRTVREDAGTDGGRRLRIGGLLALHGVTQAIEVPATVTIEGDRLTAAGEAVLRQTDFGIKPFSAGLGTVRVKNEVKVRFTIVARRRSSGPGGRQPAAPATPRAPPAAGSRPAVVR
jgi:polyisoprenoid-binding protein YceI